MPARVTALNIYPVKSLKGIALDSATLGCRGLVHYSAGHSAGHSISDRQWMIVHAEDGKFQTQRDRPAMARIHAAITADHLLLLGDGVAGLEIPLEYSGSGQVIHSQVWKDSCETVDEGDAAAHWLSQALDSPQALRLVRMRPGFSRLSDSKRFGAGASTHFADAAPYLVANKRSLDALNDALLKQNLEPVPMNRFRPNIVVEGLEPFQEHAIRNLAHRDYSLKMCEPCERCVVTTIDQDTGAKHPDRQPFKTLQGLNTMPGKPFAPAFAENASLAHGHGALIRTGDFLNA